jgi:hypothetical protein
MVSQSYPKRWVSCRSTGKSTIAAVKLALENLLGVLFGLLRGVGVLEVGLVTAGDLSFRHVDCGKVAWKLVKIVVVAVVRSAGVAAC